MHTLHELVHILTISSPDKVQKSLVTDETNSILDKDPALAESIRNHPGLFEFPLSRLSTALVFRDENHLNDHEDALRHAQSSLLYLDGMTRITLEYNEHGQGPEPWSPGSFFVPNIDLYRDDFPANLALYRANLVGLIEKHGKIVKRLRSEVDEAVGGLITTARSIVEHRKFLVKKRNCLKQGSSSGVQTDPEIEVCSFVGFSLITAFFD